jgi:hypothetical protein
MRNPKPINELSDVELAQMLYWSFLEFVCADELGLIFTGEPWKEGALVQQLRTELDALQGEVDRRVLVAMKENRI